MKYYGVVLILILAILFILPGCYIVRETERPRDDYFQPVVLPPQRGNSALTSAETDKLRNQLESATAEASVLRDSLSALQNYTGSLLSSTRSLIDKITELESKKFLSDSKQKEIEQDVAVLKSENERLGKKVEELQAQFASNKVDVEPATEGRIFLAPAARNSYDEALLKFYRKNYGEAIAIFSDLLVNGIADELNDNCEYWIGECRFAQRGFRDAIIQFQKVLAMENSNKKPDAYFMLGRSYEFLRDFQKAYLAYAQLNSRYPQNEHLKAANLRIAAIKKILPPVQPRIIKKRSSSI